MEEWWDNNGQKLSHPYQPKTLKSSTEFHLQRFPICLISRTCILEQHHHHSLQSNIENGLSNNPQSQILHLVINGNEPTLSKMGNSDLKRVQTKSVISSLLPGSCSPNWLHGNATISKPVISSTLFNKGQK